MSVKLIWQNIANPVGEIYALWVTPRPVSLCGLVCRLCCRCRCCCRCRVVLGGIWGIVTIKEKLLGTFDFIESWEKEDSALG